MYFFLTSTGSSIAPLKIILKNPINSTLLFYSSFILDADLQLRWFHFSNEVVLCERDVGDTCLMKEEYSAVEGEIEDNENMFSLLLNMFFK